MPTAKQGAESGRAPVYKDKGWDKVCRFKTSGKLGVPYILYKSKNIVDPEVRKEKWQKARPIAPTFHHPMSELLSLVGRALYFMASRIEGDHFVLNTTTEVPGLLQAAIVVRVGARGRGARSLDFLTPAR